MFVFDAYGGNTAPAQTGGQPIMAGQPMPAQTGGQPGSEAQHILNQLAYRYGLPAHQFTPRFMQPQTFAPFRLPSHVAQLLARHQPFSTPSIPATSVPGSKPLDVGLTPSPRYL